MYKTTTYINLGLLLLGDTLGDPNDIAAFLFLIQQIYQ